MEVLGTQGDFFCISVSFFLNNGEEKFISRHKSPTQRTNSLPHGAKIQTT
jgi:hypothetical protein